MRTPPSHAALMETSGTPRREPTALCTLDWKAGRANTVDRPPPVDVGTGGEPTTLALLVSFHAVSGFVRSPWASRRSCVPPSAVTSGSVAGQDVTGNRKYVCIPCFQ